MDSCTNYSEVSLCLAVLVSAILHRSGCLLIVVQSQALTSQCVPVFTMHNHLCLNIDRKIKSAFKLSE